jgi:hypothetical protein
LSWAGEGGEGGREGGGGEGDAGLERATRSEGRLRRGKMMGKRILKMKAIDVLIN